MFHISSVKIIGFRGQNKPIEIKLNNVANFLIGKNGTGKTTLINLIASALNFDTYALSRINFREISITFESVYSKRRPYLLVRRIDETKKIFDFSIKMHSRDAGVSVRFEGTEAQWYGFHDTRFPEHHFMQHMDFAQANAVRRALSNVYRVKWLALNRSATRSEDDDESYNDDIDAKIYEVNESLSAYFSRLDGKINLSNIEFQRSWFLSFLTTESAVTPGSISRLNDLEEKSALEDIFTGFSVPKGQFKRRLDRHFSAFKKAKEGFIKNKKVLLDDYLVMSDTYRLHKLVESWYKLQNTQTSINTPKLKLTHKVTEMFFRKNVSINSSNRLAVHDENGLELPLSSLSSGEKQMIIFLGETLLQENESYIFIADEPELSLHVDWQETLVSNIRSLNPNAQIFFATHSPDIVSTYSNGVYDMETLI